MAKDGAHLAGGEIEDGAIVGVIHKAAGRAFNDERLEAAAVADQMIARILPELEFGIFGHSVVLRDFKPNSPRALSRSRVLLVNRKKRSKRQGADSLPG